MRTKQHEKVRGRVERVFYASPTFSAGRLRTDGGDTISFAGNLFATEGEQVLLAGAWEKHPQYGRQFKVAHLEVDMPHDAEGLAQYLASLSRPKRSHCSTRTEASIENPPW